VWLLYSHPPVAERIRMAESFPGTPFRPGPGSG
jgi:hypothetical protein